MNRPLMHVKTQTQLDLLLKHPVHGVILYGESGIGKLTIARWLADELKLKTNVIKSDEKLTAISIDQIRALYTSTKTGRPQMIIIKNAHEMGTEAQNAFLKLLEEPPENTLFVLTTDNTHKMLATILSRVRQVAIYKPTEAQFVDYYQNQSKDFLQSVRIAGHLPGQLSKIHSSENEHSKLNESMSEAKKFYMSDSYSRSVILSSHSYEPKWAKGLISNINRILQSLILVKSTDEKSLKRLINQIQVVNQVEDSITKLPGNPKIHLTKLSEML